MLTDDDYPRRKFRPDTGRTGSKRSLDAFTPPLDEPAQAQGQGVSPPPSPNHSDIQTEISGLVGEAVRAGYDVINENLRQGRAAADAYSANRYKLGEATQDLNKLGKRLVGLSRELSTTWFDLLAAAVRDPDLQAALQSQGHQGHQGHQPPAAMPPAPPAEPVSIAVEIRGSTNASGTATPLSPQARPIHPVACALNPIGASTDLPPIERVGFGATPAGGLRIIVGVPVDQPPGRYQGLIVDGESGATLSVITVDVHA